MSIKLPRKIFKNVRAVESLGHHLTSLGTAMFRCTQCPLERFLDEYPHDLFRTMERCPGQPKDPKNWLSSDFRSK